MPSFLAHSLVQDASFVIDLVLEPGYNWLQPWVRDPKTIARTRALQAIVPPNRSKVFSELIKATPAPALESLTVASIRNGLFFDQDVVGLGRVDDTTLFAGAVPLLRNVCLISVKVPAESTILRDLTVLRLCNTNVIGDAKRVEETTKLGPILGILSRCPRLESLVLDKSLPDVTEGTKLKTHHSAILNPRFDSRCISRQL